MITRRRMFGLALLPWWPQRKRITRQDAVAVISILREAADPVRFKTFQMSRTAWRHEWRTDLERWIETPARWVRKVEDI